MQVTLKSRLQYRLQHIIFVCLLLCLVGLLGWLSNEYRVRSDWTSGARHSLSADSIRLLEQLDASIQVRSYQTDKGALLKAIKEIFARYRQHTEHFNYQILNPEIYIEQAKADKITQVGQTVIEYKGRREVIPNISEQALSNALLRLHRDQAGTLLFVSQHGERDISSPAPIGYALFANKLVEKGFKVKAINLLRDPIINEAGNAPQPQSILVLGSINQALLQSEQQKIRRYIELGGSLLWLQDPSADPSQAFLKELLDIEFTPGVVVENNAELTRMLQLSHPAVIPILEYRMHAITRKMQYFTLFTTAAAIKSKAPGAKSSDPENAGPENAGPENTDNGATQAWQSAELLISSAQSWSETGNFLLGTDMNPAQDIPGPHSIGLALHREVTNQGLAQQQRAVVIGDTDFVSNNHLGQGANLDFILNSINWLSTQEKLISIAPKNAPDLRLELSSGSATFISLVFLVGLPLGLFAGGGLIWFKRRKQ